jgi:hypothetical protein
MPVPPLIPPQQTNPLNMLMLMATLQDREAEGELRRERIFDLKRQRAQEEAYGRAVPKIDTNLGIDQPAVQEIARNAPKFLPQTMNMMNVAGTIARKQMNDNPEMYANYLRQAKALENNPNAAQIWPQMRMNVVNAAGGPNSNAGRAMSFAIPETYDPEFVDRAIKLHLQSKGHGIPQFKSTQIGDKEAGGVFDPLAPPDKSFSPIPGLEGPKTLHTPQWFENPDNPKEGTWVRPGQQPPAGYVPKSQATIFTKETEKKEDKQILAQMLVNSEMSPKTLSKRGDYNTILASAKKIDPNFNPGNLELKWYGAQRWLSSLSSPQQARMEIAGQRVIDTVDEIKRLSSEMNLSGFHPLNYAELESKVKLAGNTPEGQLATQYITAVNDLKELMATAASGGYAPTESAWKLANQQINANFGVKQMHASLNELQKLMRINVNAGKEMRMQAGGGLVNSPEKGGKISNQLSNEERQAYDTKLSQVKAMSEGPQKQKMLQQMQELGKKWGIE